MSRRHKPRRKRILSGREIRLHLGDEAAELLRQKDLMGDEGPESGKPR